MTRAHLKSSFLAAALLTSGQVFAADTAPDVVGQQLYPTAQSVLNGVSVDLGKFRAPRTFTTETVEGSNQLVLQAQFGNARVDVVRCNENYFPRVDKVVPGKGMSVNVSASCVPYNPADVAATSGETVSRVSVGDTDYTVVRRSRLSGSAFALSAK